MARILIARTHSAEVAQNRKRPKEVAWMKKPEQRYYLLVLAARDHWTKTTYVYLSSLILLIVSSTKVISAVWVIFKVLN